ncbi:MAG: FLAP-like endonuclease XPG [Edafosvirus sp.]|uniref:FLAP-like endonuclease XPG n=1 Tax=Edafosvirus sp. TaxID=2487765 RepID=A0A3G4ZTK2_9VIRU|nr:MAG: FLAP-like endonuclease XPG [Edafosvirus sp.]
MGVSKFLKRIKQVIRRKHYTECKDELALIDTHQRICNCVIAIRGNGSDMTTKDGKIKSHLFAIWSYALLLIRRSIKPLFVFDGKTVSRKKVKVKERRDAKEKAQEICDNTEDKESDTWKKNFKRSFKLDRSHIEECQQLLTHMGIPFVQAPEEADSQIAAMSQKWKCPAVTKDSDVLPYGAYSMWTECSGKDKFITIVTKQDVLDEYKKMVNLILIDLGKKPITEFKQEYLIDISCFMGTDYDDGIRIKGLSFETLLRFYTMNDFDGTKMIAFMEEEKKRSDELLILEESKKVADFSKIIIPKNYVDVWNGARGVYLEAKIIDPDTICKEMKRPNKEKVVELLCTVNEFDKKTISSQVDELIRFYEQNNMPTDNRFFHFRSYQKKHLNQQYQRKSYYGGSYDYKKTHEYKKASGHAGPAGPPIGSTKKKYYRYTTHPPTSGIRGFKY